MIEYIITILIFTGVIAMTAVVFCIWIASILVRSIIRGIVGLFAMDDKPPMQMGARGIICQNEHCRALNTESARFCRRCGRELPQAQRVTAKRVAMG